jgi:signal transduction histidine kinase
MKLSKKLEAEVLKAYNQMWQSYIKGEMKTFASYLHPKIKIIGTAEKEIFSNKKAAVKFYTATEAQVTGIMQMRNRHITLTPVESNVLIDERCQCYLLINSKWTFYGPIRISSLFTNEKGKWLNFYQHGSFPDARAGEGEQFATEKIKKENQQLKEAVQRRTVELEEKNRELEIETSLERVRAVAMGMKKADDMLTVCKTISQQLALLGINEIRNIQTAVFYTAKGTYMNYEYYTKHDKSIFTEVDYSSKKVHKDQQDFAKKMLSGEGSYYSKSFKGQQLKDWYQYQKGTEQLADRYLLKAHSLNYYMFSLGFVTLGISTYYPLSKPELDLFRRFLNVLQLAYRSYLDIEKAEAQIREAQIQLALERVRARTLAMQKSEELFDVAHILHEQFVGLGETTLQMTIGISNEAEKLFDTSVTDWSGKGKSVFTKYQIPFTEPSLFKDIYNDWKKNQTSVVIELKGERLKKWVAYRNKLSGVKVSANKPRIITAAFFSKGFIAFSKHETSDAATVKLLERFASVFNQTYTRFLDLQKAEAQAREAEVQLALERVRARTMAMQQSSELREIVAAIYEQLRNVGFTFGAASIVIMDKVTGNMDWWIHGFETPYPESYNNSYFEHPFYVAQLNNWKAGKKYAVMEVAGKSKKLYDEYIFSKTDFVRIPAATQNVMKSFKKITFSNAYMQYGALSWSAEPITDYYADILQRFAYVFEQSYTRFLDLQKAEAQAREAQIELALERVRARTMAMQKSIELREIVAIIYEQLQNLGFTYGACGIVIMDEASGDMNWWMAGFEKKDYPENYNIPYFEHPFYLQQLSNWKKKEVYAVMETAGEAKKKYDEYMFSQTDFARIEPEAKKIMTAFEKITFSNAYMKHGALSWGPTPIDKELAGTLQRFAKVFEQTYTRFLDLQKAEAQAREAQIEAALERVRSRTMAMHKSDELKEIIIVVSEQLQKLGYKFSNVSFITHNADYDLNFWMSAPGVKEPILLQVPYLNNPAINNLKQMAENDIWFSTDILTADENVEWNRHVIQTTWLKDAPKETKNYLLRHTPLAKTNIRNRHIAFAIGNYAGIPYTDEENEVFKRFANVFEQSYTRFLDLQKAEAQAREAQIEAALERVRSKAMAMHNSTDLPGTASIAFTELKKLGFIPIRCGISIQNKENRKNLLYSAVASGEGDNLSLVGWATLDHHPVLAEIYNQWMKSEDYFPELKGEVLKSYYEQIRNSFHVPVEQSQQEQYGYFMYFTHGTFYGWCENPVTEDEKKLLKRFAAVIDLTFKRYFDLQKAEAQAREAQIEAALEKVRSRTLAMQKSDELAETAAEVFKQLIALGIEPNRLYIGIVNGETRDMEMWATDEDGTGVGIKFSFNAGDNDSVMKLYEGWASKVKSVTVDMQGKELETYFKYLQSLQIPISHGLKQKRRVQSVAYFDKGFIGMASPDELTENNIHLLERFAAVFNLTFTRFNDLKIAEAHALQAEEDLIAIKEAKQKAEAALIELQATQKQLIQSEKMASLGELTAGIAHEIQNPLNFVNNFSEVSGELLKELVDEVAKGNTEEVKAIATDLVGNLEKINHHGKRAADIVKGMLQHSRTSTGQKEWTDINALCDEYLRLAYHGLRAKDKSFNAKFETSFDESIGKLNIIPQDMGRVILNLINNAFYAVNELIALRQAQGISYEPTVTVSTKKENNKVLISVADNGNGIPASIKDKIFQPFFTTKPTGRGTGLGLSLSYDIVKAHGGELKVETIEEEGTTFIITLG